MIGTTYLNIKYEDLKDIDKFSKEFEIEINDEKMENENGFIISEIEQKSINSFKRIKESNLKIKKKKFKPISNFHFLEEYQKINKEIIEKKESKREEIKETISEISTKCENLKEIKVEENLEENLEEKCEEIISNFMLHKMIFDKDALGVFNILKKFSKTKELLTKIINQKDLRGNTPVMLCVLLRSNEIAQEYLEILQILFNYDANPKLKNQDHFSPIELATSLEDIESVSVIFQHILSRRQKKITRHLDKASLIISSIPNFYLEMFWEVNVPLLSFMCPKDTCRIWKYDHNVRMDYSFVQFKNLSSVRRPSSFLFRQNKLTLAQEVFRIDHKSKFFYNPFESFEEQEKLLIIKDILGSNRINADFKLKDCAINESKSYWSGKPVYEMVDGFKCQKYEINVRAYVNIHSKEKMEYINLKKSTYFNQDENLNKKSTLLMDDNKLKNHLVDGLKVDNDTIRNQIIKIDNTKKDKKLTAFIWVAENYPIHSSHLVSLFDSLYNANEFTDKIKEFLHEPEVTKITNKNGFPIKIKIPFNLLIDITVTFSKFKILDESELLGTFEIANSYKQISREKADDIKNDNKRRFAYANIQG